MKVKEKKLKKKSKNKYKKHFFLHSLKNKNLQSVKLDGFRFLTGEYFDSLNGFIMKELEFSLQEALNRII